MATDTTHLDHRLKMLKEIILKNEQEWKREAPEIVHIAAFCDSATKEPTLLVFVAGRPPKPKAQKWTQLKFPESNLDIPYKLQIIPDDVQWRSGSYFNQVYRTSQGWVRIARTAQHNNNIGDIVSIWNGTDLFDTKIENIHIESFFIKYVLNDRRVTAGSFILKCSSPQQNRITDAEIVGVVSMAVNDWAIGVASERPMYFLEESTRLDYMIRDFTVDLGKIASQIQQDVYPRMSFSDIVLDLHALRQIHLPKSIRIIGGQIVFYLNKLPSEELPLTLNGLEVVLRTGAEGASPILEMGSIITTSNTWTLTVSGFVVKDNCPYILTRSLSPLRDYQGPLYYGADQIASSLKAASEEYFALLPLATNNIDCQITIGHQKVIVDGIKEPKQGMRIFMDRSFGYVQESETKFTMSENEYYKANPPLSYWKPKSDNLVFELDYEMIQQNKAMAVGVADCRWMEQRIHPLPTKLFDRFMTPQDELIIDQDTGLAKLCTNKAPQSETKLQVLNQAVLQKKASWINSVPHLVDVACIASRPSLLPQPEATIVFITNNSGVSIFDTPFLQDCDVDSTIALVKSMQSIRRCNIIKSSKLTPVGGILKNETELVLCGRTTFLQWPLFPRANHFGVDCILVQKETVAAKLCYLPSALQVNDPELGAQVKLFGETTSAGFIDCTSFPFVAENEMHSDCLLISTNVQHPPGTLITREVAPGDHRIIGIVTGFELPQAGYLIGCKIKHVLEAFDLNEECWKPLEPTPAPLITISGFPQAENELLVDNKFTYLHELRAYLELEASIMPNAQHNFAFVTKIGDTTITIKQEEEKSLLIADMGESIQVKQVPKTATVSLEANAEINEVIERWSHELHSRFPDNVVSIVPVQRVVPEVVVYIKDMSQVSSHPIWLEKFHCTFLQDEKPTGKPNCSLGWSTVDLPTAPLPTFPTPTQVQEIEYAIKNSSRLLAGNHTNVRMIHQGNHKVNNTNAPCVSIGVKTKGFIPLGDKILPEFIWIKDSLTPMSTTVEEIAVTDCVNPKPLKFYQDPLVPGLGIGVQGCYGFGTGGAFFVDKNRMEDNMYIMTNSHVVHPAIKDCNRLIEQPCLEIQEFECIDNGCVIGQIASQYRDNWENPHTKQKVGLDTALIKYIPAKRNIMQTLFKGVCKSEQEYKAITQIETEETRENKQALKQARMVLKHGAQTNQTTGIIELPKAYLEKPLKAEKGFKQFHAENQIVIQGFFETFADKGDSGSVVFHDGTKKVIGQLHAIADAGFIVYAFISPIWDILQYYETKNYDLELYTTGAMAPAESDYEANNENNGQSNNENNNNGHNATNNKNNNPNGSKKRKT